MLRQHRVRVSVMVSVRVRVSVKVSVRVNLVYEARPISRRRERVLADVISMHEVLTNQILLRDFS